MRVTFAFVASALVVALVLRTLNYFSDKRNNPVSVKAQVFLSWTLSVSILTLVPLDVGYALSQMGNEENGGAHERTDDGNVMTHMWGVTYWSTFLLTWVILPLHQIYEDSGDFTFASRCLKSLHLRSLISLCGRNKQP